MLHVACWQAEVYSELKWNVLNTVRIWEFSTNRQLPTSQQNRQTNGEKTGKYILPNHRLGSYSFSYQQVAIVVRPVHITKVAVEHKYLRTFSELLTAIDKTQAQNSERNNVRSLGISNQPITKHPMKLTRIAWADFVLLRSVGSVVLSKECDDAALARGWRTIGRAGSCYTFPLDPFPYACVCSRSSLSVGKDHRLTVQQACHIEDSCWCQDMDSRDSFACLFPVRYHNISSKFSPNWRESRS